MRAVPHDSVTVSYSVKEDFVEDEIPVASALPEFPEDVEGEAKAVLAEPVGVDNDGASYHEENNVDCAFQSVEVS